MCGHGTIGTVTMAIEHGLIDAARRRACVNLDTPAGRVTRAIGCEGAYVDEVRITNVPSLPPLARASKIDCPGLGQLAVDVAYGGNFYAIVDPQPNFRDIADVSAGDLLRCSPALRRR